MFSVHSEVRSAWNVRPDYMRQILRGEFMHRGCHTVLSIHSRVADIKFGRAYPASPPFEAVRNVISKFDLFDIIFLNSKASKM